MKNSIQSKSAFLGLILACGVSFSLAQEPNTNTDLASHQAKIEQAIQARDYQAWKAEHDAVNPNDTRLQGKITAENFEKFAQMIEAKRAGNMEKAQSLRNELGIEPKGQGLGNGAGKGQNQGMGKGCKKGDGQRMKKGQGKGKGMGGQKGNAACNK